MYKNHVAVPTLLNTLVLGALMLGFTACKNDSNAAEAGSAAKEASPLSNSGELSLEQFATRLESSRPGLTVSGTEATEANGIVRMDIGGGRPIYVVKGTDYFFVGELYRNADTGLVNVTEQEKTGLRKDLLAKLAVKDMIVFAPQGEVKKHITVYTDVDCGYCQKLHLEVPELNAMGIEVRYLAFPRAGIGSASYDKIASAWCADDPKTALTKVKNREEIPIKVCEGNPVEAQYEVGKLMGVTGTPTILLDNGDSIPGYLPAQELASRLGL